MRLTAGKLLPRLVSRRGSEVRIALVAGQALLLPRDEVMIRIRIGAGCTLQLEDIGGTVAYGGDDPRALWRTEVELAAGARLTWAGKPFVVADGADVRRRFHAEMAMDARLVLRETLVLGRAGERGGRIDTRTVVSCGGRPALADGLIAAGRHPQPGVLGEHRVLDALTVVGIRPSPDPHALTLESPGAVARHFAAHTHDSPIDDLWSRWSADVAALTDASQASALV